jgi:alpha-tubulin suppressor-like RCC1 family protein
MILLGASSAFLNIKITQVGAALTGLNLFSWGDNTDGELGNGTVGVNNATPAPVPLPSGVTPTAIAIAGAPNGEGTGYSKSPPLPAMWTSYALGSDGNVYPWGSNAYNQFGVTNANGAILLPGGVTATAIAAGAATGYAIGSDGNIYSWGGNETGALGAGNACVSGFLGGCSSGEISGPPVVVQLPAGVTATAIAAGAANGYAIGSDGNLYSWGDNSYGELGNASSANFSDLPVVVQLPAGVTPLAIAAGANNGYAVGSDGNLYSWGEGLGLGNGSTLQTSNGGPPNSSVPVVVELPAGVTAKSVTGGAGFAHAIGSDGNLYAWGFANSDALGTAATPPSGSAFTTPIEITLAPGVTATAVSDSLDNGYAIGSDDNLYAWGSDAEGQLGNGVTPPLGPSTLPEVVSLPIDTDPVALASGSGAESGLAIINLSPATHAPVVTVDPDSQSVVDGNTTGFTAAAVGQPSPAVQWQFSVNGGSSWISIAGATSTTLTTGELTAFEDGWQFRAVFTNIAGSATTTAATMAVIPVTTLVLPSNGATVSGSSVLDATASPGTNRVQYELSGNGLTDMVVATGTPTIYGWLALWNSTTVPNGNYTVQSKGYFPSGSSGTSASINITVNNAPPTTGVLLPSSGANQSGNEYLDASASTGVSSVSFEITGGSFTDQIISGATLTAYGWIGSWNTTTVPNGTYTLESMASFAGGVTGTSAPATITVDNPPPTSSVVLPRNGAPLSGTNWLDTTTSLGVSQVVYEITGGTLTNAVIATGTPTVYGWLAGWNSATVPDGTYTLQSVASYVGGVTGTSAPITITVAN